MNILCIGRSGQVAQSLRERSDALGINLISTGRPDLDLSKPDSLDRALDRYSPTILVNAAAYTAVDDAETDRDAAFEVNANGVSALARLACDREIPLIHISTDYVFDGAKPEPYSENDQVNPLGVYGASKFAGEEEVRRLIPHHLILRTAWVYSPYGKNFVKTMLRLAESRDSVSVVSDQRGSPTSALDIADGILKICSKVSSRDGDIPFGTYHLTGAGAATWAEFAEFIFKIREQSGYEPVDVNWISSSEYPTPVSRPQNSVLDSTKLKVAFGVSLPDWRSSSELVVKQLLDEGNSSK